MMAKESENKTKTPRIGCRKNSLMKNLNSILVLLSLNRMWKDEVFEGQ